MKRLMLFLFCCIYLVQCADNKKIVGTWINRNDFVDAEITRFYDDYFVFVSPYSGEEYEEKFAYSIVKDSVYLSILWDIAAYKLVVKKDSLEFIYNEKEASLYVERYQDKNILDFFNRKYEQHIQLPELELYEFNYRRSIQPSVLFVSYQGDTAKLFYNGTALPIDTLLHSKFVSYPDSDRLTIQNVCFFDTRTPYSIVRLLKKELAKASLTIVKYVTVDAENKLCELPNHLTPLEDFFFSKRGFYFFFEIYENKILNNGRAISIEELNEMFVKAIEAFPYSSCEFYVDDETSYGYYLYVLNAIRLVYDNARNEYAKQQYGVTDYRSIEDEDILSDIRWNIPMNFKELWNKKNVLGDFLVIDEDSESYQ